MLTKCEGKGPYKVYTCVVYGEDEKFALVSFNLALMFEAVRPVHLPGSKLHFYACVGGKVTDSRAGYTSGGSRPSNGCPV